MIDFLTKFELAFDIAGIERSHQRATRRYLFRAAGKARRQILRKLRRRRNTSSPGSPPHVHTSGNSGLRNVRFEVNVSLGSAVVGPVKFQSRTRSSDPVPAVLEDGGTVEIPIRRRGRGRSRRRRSRRRRGSRSQSRRRSVSRGRSRVVRIAKRPYVGPAFDEIKPTLALIYADAFSYGGIQ